MFNKLKIFTKVIECGNFSKAAKALNTTTSSVSRHIDALERELEIKLLNRSTRHIELTEAGEKLLDRSKKLIADFDDTINMIKPTTNEPEGYLKISVFESFGRLCICPLLPKFLAKYPKINIDIALENQMTNLYRDEIDLAIRIGEPEDSSLVMKKLVNNRVVVCATPKYFEAHTLPKSPNDLTNHNCLTVKNNNYGGFWYFKKANQCLKVPISGNLVSQGGAPLLIAGKQNAGVLLLSYWMVKSELEKNELTEVLTDWQASLYENGSGSIYAVFKSNKYMKPALRTFIDYIVEELSGM